MTDVPQIEPEYPSRRLLQAAGLAVGALVLPSLFSSAAQAAPACPQLA